MKNRELVTALLLPFSKVLQFLLTQLIKGDLEEQVTTSAAAAAFLTCTAEHVFFLRRIHFRKISFSISLQWPTLPFCIE